MGMEQEQEWAEAQKISVSVDLVEAAKKLLQFLAIVDRSRFLYEDHALEKAIYRYNACWIPLLAKHVKKMDSEEPLVVPLDCEWIWHCHRLNPVRYKFDCEKSFGTILGNNNVISSTHGPPKSKTEEIWKELYPEEPYELDLNKPVLRDYLHENFTDYDLLSAVKRQISFTFQVSRPYISNDLFLQEAMARYKGFLHLIRSNNKMSLQRFCVPTYDIDLMWHTHQLYPHSYCKDMKELIGFVVQHNDSDSDRTKGSKLDLGHSETTRQWEKSFGLSYRKAGTMYKGRTPTPVMLVPYQLKEDFKTFDNSGKEFQFPIVHSVEVLLELMEIKNLPEEYKENIVVAFSKKQPDKVFKTKRSFGISSNYKEKCFVVFQCEPTGELLFEVFFHPPSNAPTPKSLKLLGSDSFLLKELFGSHEQLSTKKWVSVDFASGFKNFEPVLLHVSISFTPPTPAPYLFQLQSKTLTNAKTQTDVMDSEGKKVFTLQTRNIMKDATNCIIPLREEIYYVTDSGEIRGLLELNGSDWCIKGNHCSFKLQRNSKNDESLFDLIGFKMVKLFPGRRLEFEPADLKDTKVEQDFVTAVEFSAEYPYGRAVALLNSKLKTAKAIDEWIVLPAIALVYILSNFTMEGYWKENIIEDADHVVRKKGFGNQCISKCGNYGDNADVLAYDCQCVKCAPCGYGLSDNKVGGNELPQESFIIVNEQCNMLNNYSCSAECSCTSCAICSGGCREMEASVSDLPASCSAECSCTSCAICSGGCREM